MLIRALFLKDTITIFVSQNMVADKDSKNLSECIMTREDWAYCSDVIAFMKPLFLLIKDLEGKPESGANGFIADVLPAFDFMADHLDDQLQAFKSQTFINEKGEEEKSLAYTNTLNALAKLQKYKDKNVSPVLFAACVLVPWRKWSYFEEWMTSKELEEAKKIVLNLWTTKYAGIPVVTSIIVENRRGCSLSEPQIVRIIML